jgi:hypothetical protein
MGFSQNPYGGPPQVGPTGGGYGHYEFNDTENAVVDKTASRAKLWGIISITLGVLQLGSSCGALASPMMATNLPAGIVGIVVGISFLGVGNSLKAVVQTQGNDVAHMMQALEKMGGAFLVQIICAIAGFVLTVIAMLIVAFVFMAVVAAS